MQRHCLSRGRCRKGLLSLVPLLQRDAFAGHAEHAAIILSREVFTCSEAVMLQAMPSPEVHALPHQPNIVSD